VSQTLAEKTKVMYNWLIVFVAFGSIGIYVFYLYKMA